MREVFSVCISGLMRFALAVGRPVEGVYSAFNSYRSAVVVLQQAFYKEYDCVLIDDGFAEIGKPYPLDQPMLKEWTRLLEDRDWISAERLLKELSQVLVQHQSNQVTTVKQFYALMALALDNLKKSRGIDPSYAGQDGNPQFWDLLGSMETLQEVNEFLHRKLTEASLEDTHASGNFIEEVVRYIKQHYAEDDLSVAMLAERGITFVSVLSIHSFLRLLAELASRAKLVHKLMFSFFSSFFFASVCRPLLTIRTPRAY
jgi:two-component system response regulator YesN